MRSAWVNKSLRRFPLLRPGTSTSSPILGIALVARGGLTFRNLFSCIQKRPAPSPLLSGLLPTIDVCSGGRRATMLGSVRYVTCNMHRRTGGLVQFALTTRTRFSSTGVQPTAVPPGPISVLGTRSCSFSTSANGASKKLEILDGSQVAEADVAEVMEPTKEEPRHAHIELPSITDADRTATLTSWKVDVGDVIQVGDVVCEIELEHFSVGVKVETPGFLAEILVAAGTESVPVGADIGTIVHSEEDIEFYQQAQKAQASESDQGEVAAEPGERSAGKTF